MFGGKILLIAPIAAAIRLIGTVGHYLCDGPDEVIGLLDLEA